MLRKNTVNLKKEKEKKRSQILDQRFILSISGIFLFCDMAVESKNFVHISLL